MSKGAAAILKIWITTGVKITLNEKEDTIIDLRCNYGADFNLKINDDTERWFIIPDFIKKVKLPKDSDLWIISHIHIGKGFEDMNSLLDCEGIGEIEYVEVDEANPYYKCVDGIVYNHNLTRFVFMPQFYNLKSEIHIPDTVYYFEGIYSIRSSIQKVNIPKALQQIRPKTFSFLDIKEITIPKNVKSIGKYGFSMNSKLKSVIFEGEDCEFGDGAFCTCHDLKYVKLPQKLKRIGSRFLELSASLTEIELPDTLEVIEKQAFANSGLKHIVIPESVKYIGRRAFQSCYDLEYVIFKGKPFIHETAFENSEDTLLIFEEGDENHEENKQAICNIDSS